MQQLGNLLDLLLNAKIDFVLIGGFASIIHGSSMVTQDLDGKKCKVISMEDLIASKKYLARDKDLAVVRQLEAIKNN